MHWPALMLLLVLAPPVASAAQPAQPPCASASDCALQVNEAIAGAEFERAHDLAWRAVQLGPRNDISLMFLLARAQSLSGRPHDALVMLRRLTALGFRSSDPETHDDFRRVRSLPGWPETLAALAGEPTSASEAPRDRAPLDDALSKPAASPAAAGAAPAATVTAGAPDAPAEAGIAPRTAPATTALPVPVVPVALAYDSVSDRFVVVDESSDTLKIVDERTGHVINLVSPGWSGAHRPAAVAIDVRRGELWAAGVDTTGGTPQSTIYKLQLVSGRLLQTIALPRELGASRIVDLVVGRDLVFLLDTAGRRILALGVEAKTPRVAANLVSLERAVSIAAAGDAVVYVAHARGLARVDLAARSRLPTPVPAAADLHEIESISWHDGSLFAIQRNSNGRAAARIRLDARGTAATKVDLLGPAASAARGVYGGIFYYVAPDSVLGMVLLGTRAQ